MKKCKEIVNRSLIDNTKMQTEVNRIGHYVITWFVFPFMVIGFLVWSVAASLSEDMLVESIFGLVGLLFITVIGYSYYLPKGYKKYFYIVFATPMILDLIFFTVCLILKFI